MADNFGIQYFDENGILLWDNSAAFTRILGSIYIPEYDADLLPISGTISIGGNGKLGKPFCFVVPCMLESSEVIRTSANSYHSPTVKFTIDTIIWTYTKACSAHNTDMISEGSAGNVNLFYGVYGR